MSVAIGGWIRFMTGIDEMGDTIVGIKDPAGGERLKELAIGVVADPNEVTVGMLLHEYFGEEVASHPGARLRIIPRISFRRPLLARPVAAPFRRPRYLVTVGMLLHEYFGEDKTSHLGARLSPCNCVATVAGPVHVLPPPLPPGVKSR
jgi:hypothetical protein